MITIDENIIILQQTAEQTVYHDLQSGQEWIIRGKCSHPDNPPCLQGAVNPTLDKFEAGKWIIDRLDIPTRPEGCDCNCGLSGEYL